MQRAEQKGKGRKSEGLSYLRLEKSNTEIHTGYKSSSETRPERKGKKGFQVTEEILLIQEAPCKTQS